VPTFNWYLERIWKPLLFEQILCCAMLPSDINQCYQLDREIMLIEEAVEKDEHQGLFRRDQILFDIAVKLK
jgi:hypothetical protein